MKKIDMYTNFLIKCLEKEISTAKQNNADYLKIDIKELEILLSEVNSMNEFSAEEKEEVHFCICCAKPTLVTRSEQYVIKPHSIQVEVKCLDCVIDTLKGDQCELEQTIDVNWFLKEHDLEEEFEAFRIELSHRKQD